MIFRTAKSFYFTLDKTSRKIEDGKRIVFNLLAEREDFAAENDEGCYLCYVKILDAEDNIVDEYYRKFLVEKFKKPDYWEFINQFCKDTEYREQYNKKNDIEEERTGGEIDERIVGLIGRLNELGLETIFSCQGTDDEWSDKPGKKDGHSFDAYITFVNPLPTYLARELKKDDRLRICEWDNSVRSAKRQYNRLFPEIISAALDKWSPTKEKVQYNIAKMLWEIIEDNTPHYHVASEDYWTGDRSGETKEMEISQLIELKDSSLTELLSEIYTGCSVATHESHMGLMWTTYYEELEDKFSEYITENFAVYDADEDEFDIDLEDDLCKIRDEFLKETDSKLYFEEILIQLCIAKNNRKIDFAKLRRFRAEEHGWQK